VSDYVTFTRKPELVDLIARTDLGDDANDADEKKFEPHLALPDIQRGIKAKKYQQGVFHINRSVNSVVFLHGFLSCVVCVSHDLVGCCSAETTRGRAR
jgi:hypothetical protein